MFYDSYLVNFNKMLIIFDQMLQAEPKFQNLRLCFFDISALKSDLRVISFFIYVITLIFCFGAITWIFEVYNMVIALILWGITPVIQPI